MMASNKSWPWPGWAKRQGITVVLGVVPLIFFIGFMFISRSCIFLRFYVYLGMNMCPRASLGPPWGAMSLIPRIKYLRMSGTIILDNENVVHDATFIYWLGKERCILSRRNVHIQVRLPKVHSVYVEMFIYMLGNEKCILYTTYTECTFCYPICI